MKTAALLLAAFVFAACARERTPAPPAPSLKPECGEASYYHGSLAGNLTANGEIYDPAHFTAAHQELPFDTVLRVARRDDGRSVTVRINDRGPFIEGRIIDLAPAAAERLGLTDGEGVADVCLLAPKTLGPLI